MRPSGTKSINWRTWKFNVVGKDAQGRTIVGISTVNGTPSPAKCEGSIRPSADTCSDAKVSIGAGARWIVEPAMNAKGAALGAFSLIAAVSL